MNEYLFMIQAMEQLRDKFLLHCLFCVMVTQHDGRVTLYFQYGFCYNTSQAFKAEH